MTEPDDFGMQRRLGFKEVADREKYIGEQQQHGGDGAAVKAEISDGGTLRVIDGGFLPCPQRCNFNGDFG